MGGIDQEQVVLGIILIGLFILFIGPLIHIVASRRSHGGAKFGWFLAYLFFSWIAYIVFLIITQKTVDQNIRKINKFKFIILVTIFHFLLSVVIFFVSYTYGMIQFDAGNPVGILEKIMMFISNTLRFPLIFPFPPVQWVPKTIFDQFGDDLVKYITAFLNSLIWGTCSWGVYSRLKKTDN